MFPPMKVVSVYTEERRITENQLVKYVHKHNIKRTSQWNSDLSKRRQEWLDSDFFPVMVRPLRSNIFKGFVYHCCCRRFWKAQWWNKLNDTTSTPSSVAIWIQFSLKVISFSPQQQTSYYPLHSLSSLTQWNYFQGIVSRIFCMTQKKRIE